MPEIRNQPRAVVLLSGGLDSATTLAVARRDGFSPFALTVDYGQRHRRELDCAASQARLQAAAEHRRLTVDLRAIGGSALTDDIDVPKNAPRETIGRQIPATYVPARNTILLSLALGYAETVGAFDLFIGANAIDYSGYPDCRPAFLDAFASLANLATAVGVENKGAFRVHAPLINLSKAEIIRLGYSLAVDFRHTLSCYDPDASGRPCRQCDSCILRAAGFRDAGLADSVLNT
jgi:7-cyano-7-deazaguanine synthase